MSCKDYELKLGAYVDGEISSQDRNEVETHLGACQVCTRLAEDFRGLDEIAAASKAPPVSGEEWSRIFQEILLNRETAARKMASEEERRVIIPFEEAESTRATVAPGTGTRKLLLAITAAAALILFGLYLGSSLFEPGAPEPGAIANPGTPTEPSEKGDDFADRPEEPEPEIQGETEDELFPEEP